MDTAATKIRRLEASIAREGETILLERLSTDPTTGVSVVVNSVTVAAWTRSSIPQDLIDNEARDIRVVISPTLLFSGGFGSPPVVFGMPIRDDQITVQGIVGNLQTVSPIYYKGEVVRINLLARG